jgi:xanthine dehydrogenase accessory factor
MHKVYQALASLDESAQPGVLCTVTFTQGSTPRRAGSKMLVFPDGNIVGTIGGGELEKRVIDEALEALASQKPREVEYSMTDPQRGDPGVCGGQIKIFIDPIMPQPRLVVVGCGHVGKEVIFLGNWLGFHVIACDDRLELCNPDIAPGGHEYIAMPFEDLKKRINISSWTYVVLTTRDVLVDAALLPEVLDSDPAYIGVIGSRRRWETTKKKLIETGIDPVQFARIHSPIGLDLKAETPKEIALSILAEIIQVQKQGNQELKQKKVANK